jgi:D-alanine-D-alanine ligase
VALAAFEATGCRDYARVDMRVADDESIYILEINGNPDIGPSAGFARALGAAGMASDEFVDRLVRNAAGRRAQLSARRA